jgi:hypothetical protein
MITLQISSTIKFHPRPSACVLVYAISMKIPFAKSNVAAVKGAWPVMGFVSHQQMHGGCTAPDFEKGIT